jgi:hypothetical protein
MKLLFPMLSPQPTFDSDPAGALATRTLRSVLISVLIYTIPFFAVEIPFFAVRKLGGSLLFLCVLLGTLFSVFFLQRAKTRVASWTFLSTAWLFVTLLTLSTGGISGPALLGCLPFIIVAAFTLGRIVAWVFTALFVSMAFVLALLQNAGMHLPRQLPAPPISADCHVVFRGNRHRSHL